MNIKTTSIFSSILVLFFLAFQLNGQNRIIVSSMGKDVEYRIKRTLPHVPNAEVHKNLNTGEDIINSLKGKEPIKLWVFYSHGNDSRFFGKDPRKKLTYYSSGLTLDGAAEDRSMYPQGRTLSDLKKEIDNKSIVFDKDAIIYLGACAVAATHLETQQVFAQELANITGARIIAGEHQTEPLIENYTELIFTNKHTFYEFSPNKAPINLGEKYHVTKMISEYLKTGELHHEYKLPEKPKEEKAKEIKEAPKMEATKTVIEQTTEKTMETIEEATKKVEETIKEVKEEVKEEVAPIDKP